jgi:Raf kinase inhibitor-like YbhB/YbcL family protein
MGHTVAEFTLTSSAFAPGGMIPPRYTCDGENLSPPLSWSSPPIGTDSLALIMDDPDAPVGTFTHWLAWGIAPEARGLAEGQAGPVEGRNDFGLTGYAGPCPPPGHGRHRYVFRLYALESKLGLPAGASRQKLEQALKGHVLAVAELVGAYER